MAANGNQRHACDRSSLHRAGRSLPKRQNHAARSDPRPHRRHPAPGQRRGRQHRRRRQHGSAPSPHERRAHRRHHEFHGRLLHFPRLSRLGRVRPRHARGAAGDRRRGRRLRNGREEGAAAAAHPARAGRPENSRAFCSSTRSTRPTPASTTCSICCSRRSRTKLILRQIPTFSGDIITGFVDLALERAFVYKEHAPSEVVALEGDAADREKTARFSMLETLADHDDELMEQLLEDIQPPRDKVFDDLTRELREGLVCPVLMGTATRANGVLRLLKALRHESPGIAETAKRLGVKATGSDAVAYVLKTQNTAARRQDVDRAHARRPGRRRHDASCPATTRPAASPASSSSSARPPRSAARPTVGETVALRQARQGQDRRHADRRQAGPSGACAKIEPYPPVLAIAISAKERKDDVKLGQALNKLAEEDPSITIVHNPETHEVVLWGQGEMHLRVATERLERSLRRRHRAPPAVASATARPSAKASSSAAGTRSSPAATASTATSCSTSSRCRAARASPSRTRSPAAWCRATTSPRSRKASSTASSTGRSAFPWSICTWR